MSSEDESLSTLLAPVDHQEQEAVSKTSKWRIFMEFGLLVLIYASLQFHSLSIDIPLGKVTMWLGDLQAMPPSVAVIAALFLWLHGGLRSIDFSWPKQWKRYFIHLALLLIVFMIVEYLLANLLKHFAGVSADQGHLKMLFKIPEVAVFLLLVLLPVWAVAEEFFYRAYLIQRLEALAGSWRHSTLLAVLLSSLIFGLDHIQYGSGGVPGFMLSGLLLAGIYLYTKRNLWMVSVIHYLSNAFWVVESFWLKES